MKKGYSKSKVDRINSLSGKGEEFVSKNDLPWKLSLEKSG
jgi:hypothetical protein